MKSAKLGQNFLINRNIADKIIANTDTDLRILEIGPGKGALTKLLAHKFSEKKLVLVEFDTKLIDNLQINFKESLIINRDVLDLNSEEISSDPAERFFLVSNAPYYISAEITDWIIHNRDNLHAGVVMMQREFVEKLVNVSVKPNPRTLLFLKLFKCKKLFDVSPGSFDPKPKVISRVFSFFRREGREKYDIDKYYKFLNSAFMHPRKTLFKNLSAFHDKAKVSTVFTELGVDSKVRPEKVDEETFSEIFSLLNR